MSTRPWRGTWLFVGATVAMSAAGVAKFAPVQDVANSIAPDTGTTSDDSASTGSTSDDSASTGSTSDDSASTGSTSDDSASSGTTDAGSAGTSTDIGSSATSDTVTIVGSVEQNRYGSVQVSVTFTGNQITDVQTLQVPDRERESVQINERAAPLLAQEVIAAQSAQIDTVSGATYTSQGYADSVQSAIDQHG